MSIILTDQAPQPIGPYSQAVRVGNLLFLSGQIPLDPKTKSLAGPGVAEQTRQIFRNIQAVLAAANARLDQVVKTTVFLTDLGDFQAMNAVYADFFTAHYPARSTVQVAGLPAQSRVEIEVVACLE